MSLPFLINFNLDATCAVFLLNLTCPNSTPVQIKFHSLTKTRDDDGNWAIPEKVKKSIPFRGAVNISNVKFDHGISLVPPPPNEIKRNWNLICGEWIMDGLSDPFVFVCRFKNN